MAANALIFDLDGTVWDSATWFARVLGRGDPQAVQSIREGLVNGGNIVHLLKKLGMTRDRLLREALRSGPLPLFDGMADVLAALADRGTPLAVATSLPGTLAEPMLEAAGIARIFSAVVHAGRCRVPKPHPASILMALRLIEISASPAVFYVGDRSGDAEAASRAGISSAWLRHGYEQPSPNSGIVAIEAWGLLDL